MKRLILLAVLLLLAAAMVPSANAQWRCVYATYDDETNGTGAQTPSVGVIKENFFIALVADRVAVTGLAYMVPYVNADSGAGRRYYPGYDGVGIYEVWSDGAFDQDFMADCQTMVVRPDSFIYIANNGPDHNILVFKYSKDTVTVVPVDQAGTVYPRQITGNKAIYGIAVDNAGYVYVCNDTSNGVTNDIRIYKPVKQWSATHNDAPVGTIDLPDGIYKGLSVSPDGKMLFVSDYVNRKVIKYKGTPTGGYTKDNGFNFTMAATDTVPSATTLKPGPLGMAYLSPNNILAVACDVWGLSSGTNGTYLYGRIYLLNPNTGELISTDQTMSVVNQAAWNTTYCGVAGTTRPGGTTPGIASGYTSTWSVAWDEKKNIYTQSYFGWTAEKWNYNGTLPTITVTGVDQLEGVLPQGYGLEQNYPNPFNPTTTVGFSVPVSGFVSLKVFDLLGREVMALVNEERAAGSHRVTFDAGNLPTGTYLYTLKTAGYQETKRMVLVR
jgi:hypothetical protein